MTGREKIDAAVEYLTARGVAVTTAAPPLWRICWRAGLHLPPPLFSGFVSLTALCGVPFGLMMSALLLVPLLVIGRLPDAPTALIAPGSGLVFGLLLAAYFRWTASRLGLPSWSKFPPEQSDAETW